MRDLTKLFELSQGVDAVLVLSEKNRFYFTNFASTAGALILTKDKTVFITDPRYFEMAEDLKKDGIDTRLVEIGSSLLQAANGVLDELGAKTIGFEDTEVTFSEYQNISSALSGKTLAPVGETIMLLRSFKTDAEIGFIKTAQSFTDAAFLKILPFINENVTERDIAVELEHQMNLCGANGLAFDTIVASGINGSKPHAHPTNKKIEKGDAVTMDFGARFNGYCSDMTRTVFLGEPSQEMKNIYNIVLMAQTNAINNVSAGMTGHEIDALARELIVANGFGANFTHSTGHSLGIDIHEAPFASKICNTRFSANQIVTVEPGIYVPGFGGVRIEDMVLIKENEIEDLTKSQKTIIIL